MTRNFASRIFLLAQVLLSVLIIIAGTLLGIRSALAGQPVLALLFLAGMTYLCGFRLLLTASLDDLREYFQARKV